MKIFVIALFCGLVSTGFSEKIIGSNITPPLYSDSIIVLPMDIYADAFFSKLNPEFLSQSRILDVDVNRLNLSKDSFSRKEKSLESTIQSIGLSRYNLTNEPKVNDIETCSTISLEFDKIALIKFGNIYCALKIEKPLSDSQKQVIYHWWLQLDGSGEFSTPNILSGKGMLAKGPMVRAQIPDNKVYDWDLGSNAIKAGGFLFESSNFNRIILPDVDFGIRLGIAKTNYENIKEIPFRKETLDWKYNNVNEISEQYTVSNINGEALDRMLESK